MAKASDSVGQSNRAHLKLQHDLFFVPFSALWGFFFPLTPVTSEYSFPWLCQPGVRSHPGLRRTSLGLCGGKRCSWPCLLKRDQKDTWVTQDTKASLVSLLPKAQPVLYRVGHCGSWVPFLATSILHQEGAMKREFGCSHPALVQSPYQNGPAHEGDGGDVMP